MSQPSQPPPAPKRRLSRRAFVRLATELIPGDERPELRERVARHIDERDGLIAERLLAEASANRVAVHRPNP